MSLRTSPQTGVAIPRFDGVGHNILSPCPPPSMEGAGDAGDRGWLKGFDILGGWMNGICSIWPYFLNKVICCRTGSPPPLSLRDISSSRRRTRRAARQPIPFIRGVATAVCALPRNDIRFLVRQIPICRTVHVLITHAVVLLEKKGPHLLSFPNLL